MSHTAIIYGAPEADPATERVTTRHGNHATTVVATGDAAPESVAELAAELVGDGADVVELCGAMGLVPQAAALAAVGDRATVGAVMYGFESLTSVAAYKAGFAAGEFLPAAFLYLEPGSDPAVDRIVRADETTHTTIVAVPDLDAAVAVARELAAHGVRLIELYGGLGAEAATKVITATGAQVPVGVVSRSSSSTSLVRRRAGHRLSWQ
jgi:Family of unknown function (DUF6506)